jgi:hypothetical protein
LLDPFIKSQTYLNVEEELFIFDQLNSETLYNGLSDYFQVAELERLRSVSNASSQSLAEIHKIFRKHAYLLETASILDYLLFTNEPGTKNLWN